MEKILTVNTFSKYLAALVLSTLFGLLLTAAPAEKKPALELTRDVHSWEFLCATGKRAAIFGNEAGKVEAWVYPLKVIRDFSLTIRTNNRDLKAEALVRSITVRPESTTLLYVGDTFRVKETFFVPVNEQGAVVRFDVDTEQPLELFVSFRGDFQLEWPAGLGATYSSWDTNLHVIVFGEEHKTYSGIVGSPSAVPVTDEFDTNYGSSTWNTLRLGTTAKGKDTKLIAIAGSIKGVAEAESTYKKLIDHHADLQRESADFYADYLQSTVGLELPDAQLQQAYDWSRISILQGMVTSPYFGTGLIAGYRTSGESQRPGFAWFFGRDSLWTSLALDSEGDYSSTRDALTFLVQFQREDGKIPHEIAQTASLVNWFKEYPYGFASADATPLFIIATEEYVRTSGDVAWAKDHWDNLWKAYQFLRSTYDDTGFPRNFGVGHGWVEGGPLLPVKTELYQSAAGLEALRALSELARWTGKDSEARTLAEDFAKQKTKLNTVFWSPEKTIYAFALDQNGKRVDETSILAAVSMWFGVLDHANAKAMISQLAVEEHSTDWGTRIISNHSPLYSAGGYHFGSVWPLFTGWAAVGEYRYHQVHPALENLRANALLALDGSPGHVTEVLSGDYYQGLSTSSPHQIWSAAMVVSPMLRGLFGLHVEALPQTITLAPSLPADWNYFSIHNLHAGKATADLHFERAADELTLEIHRSGNGACTFEFQPALSLRAEVLSVELNGRPISFRVEANDSDQHLQTKFGIYGGLNTLKVRLRHDFAATYTSQLPPKGHTSEGLRILSESWSASRDQLTLQLEGLGGKSYTLVLFHGEEVVSVDGGTVKKSTGEAPASVNVTMPSQDTGSYSRAAITFHFSPKSGGNRSTP